MVQGEGSKYVQCLLIFNSKNRDLLDKLLKVLALSIEKVEETVKNKMAKDKKIAADNDLMADDICLTIPDFWTMV